MSSRSLLRAFLAVLFVLAFPLVSAAGTMTYVTSNDDGPLSGGPLPVPEWEPPSDTSTVGGNYYFCAANERWGEVCYDKGSYYYGGKRQTGCIEARYQAYCLCNTRTLVTKGVCEYRNPR